MPRPNKRTLQCRELSNSKKTTYQITNIIRYVISVAICGMSQQQAQIFLLYNNITPPTKAQFYACQQMLIPIFEKLAREICKKFADEKNDGFYIRYDGSWSSRRNATHCLVEFINEDGKIIDFEYMSRIKCTILRVETGYFGPSNRMETLLVEILTERWKHNQKVKGFVHDGDLKTPKFWQSDNEDEVPIIELHDPGHAKNRLSTIFDHSNSNKNLYGLKTQVISYFSYIVKTTKYTNDEKIQKWNSLEDKLRENPPLKSYLNPSSWRYKEQFEECHKTLTNFINNSMELFQSCLISDTQSNESFHSLKSKLAPKNISWGTSWKLRMCLAVLQWNLGEELRAFLDEKFDLNLSPENSALLTKIELSLKRKRYVSKSLEERHKRNTHRKLKSQGNKDDPDGHLYKDDQKKRRTRRKQASKDKEPVKIRENLMQSRICAGITNAGSTCFFASVIQILANTNVPSILKAHRLTQIPNSFYNVLNTVFQQLLSDADVTKDLVEHMFSFFPQYETNVQSDANEFFHFLINSLGLSFQSLFSELHRETFTCQRCGFKSFNTTIINQFELYPNSHIMNITDLINAYFSQQYVLERLCSRCQVNTTHIKRTIFSNLPKYLVLKINYNSPEYIRICRIKVLHEIKILLPSGLSQNYKLTGVLYYSGNGNNGHFWSVTYKYDQLRIHNDSRSGYLKSKSPREYGIEVSKR